LLSTCVHVDIQRSPKQHFRPSGTTISKATGQPLAVTCRHFILVVPPQEFLPALGLRPRISALWASRVRCPQDKFLAPPMAGRGVTPYSNTVPGDTHALSERHCISMWSKTRVSCWNVAGISGSGGHIAISGCRTCSKLLSLSRYGWCS